MYKNCVNEYEFLEYNFNSLRPECKNYFMKNSHLNKNWDETSKQIAIYIVLLFFPVVGYFINKSVEYLRKEIAKDNEEIPYEYKYVDEFEELLDKKNKKLKDDSEEGSTNEYSEEESEDDSEIQLEEAKKDFSQLFIEEETPRGTVGLRFNAYTDSFWWWSNTKDMPYKYLETVSRKYVIDNDCLDIYVDIRDELQKGAEKANEIKKKDEEELNEEQEKNIQRVYAKFRKYNQKASRILGGTSGSYPVLKERCNRYSYKGNLKDFHNAREAKLPDTEVAVNLEKVLKEKNDKNVSEKLTFMEWKKLNELKNNNK